MDKQTHENLLTALHGEAFAYARYSLFAAAAREQGDVRLAALFDGLASVELHEHFAELADLTGLVGANADNLSNAIKDENEETASTYPRFAESARAAGEIAVANRFHELGEDERAHARALEAALEELEVPM